MFYEIINIVGVVAFAVSGAVKGIKHDLDVLGVTILGIITAVGGGIIRDALLNEIPSSIISERDVYISLFISLVTFFYLNEKILSRRKIVKLVEVSDALGLALFALIGAEKGFVNGLGALSTGVMATLTGVGGGVIRDVLVGEIPFILKADIYAVLCLFGGIFYWVLGKFQLLDSFSPYIIIISIFLIRILIIKKKWNLPRKNQEIR